MSVLIKIRCTQEVLNFIRKPPLAAGDVQATRIEWTFCDAWKGYIKTALFSRKKKGGKIIPMILENNCCTVPREVLADRGKFYISVIGDRDGIRLTSNTLEYEVNPSLVVGEIMPSDPTPDVYAQIMNLLNKKADNITFNAEDSTIQLSANNMPIGDKIKVSTSGGSGNSIGIVKLEVNENGELIATYSDGTIDNIGKVGVCPGVYVPSKEGDKLIFTLQDNATEDKIEIDIDPNNEWSGINDATETNYVWDTIE